MPTRTDFAAFSHPTLIRMLHAGNPDAITAAGDTWAAIGRSLHDRAGDLEQQLRRFDGMWQGDAAAQYHAMISDLVDGIRQAAIAALTVRDLTYQASDALQTAWRTMPPAVDVPALDPSVLAAASTPVPTTPALGAADRAALVQRQAQAAALVQRQQQALATATGAQTQAVAVMTALADQDTAIEAGMPPTPAATVPAIAPDGTVLTSGSGVLNPSGLPVGPGTGTAAPLFSRVFTAGLAAAGAATGGRFSAAPVKLAIPSPGSAAPSATAPPAAPRVAVPAPPKLTGIGGGIGGGIGAGGIGVAPAVASPSLAGTSAVAGLAGAAGTAAGAAAAQNPAGGGFMPAMPFGMAGAGDGMAGGRRIPSWLVETEDVWGESSMVAPAVIGEEPPDPVEQIHRSWT
jgi:uncharacterized protein YukE